MINSVNSGIYNHFQTMRQMNHSSENNNNPIWSNFTFKKPKNQDNTVKTSIFYINDVHGQNIRMERLLTAVKQFDTFLQC